MEVLGLGGAGIPCVPPHPSPPGVPVVQGESGLQPTSLEFRCPALTAALPACDTVPRRSHKIKCANFSPGSKGGWGGRKLQAHPCPRWPRRSLPGTLEPQKWLALATACFGSGIRKGFLPYLLMASCRDGGGTQGRVALPTTKCHRALGSAWEEDVQGRLGGKPIATLAALQMQEKETESGEMGPQEHSGGLHRADASVLGMRRGFAWG